MALVFIRKLGPRKAEYLCHCGNTTVTRPSRVNNGTTTSCGCYRRLVSKTTKRTHGHSTGGKITKAYDAWRSMIYRCKTSTAKFSHRYKNRGIGLEDIRWEKFENFLADMGEPEGDLTLDRRDNDRGYSKDNCRWATWTTQARNRSSNVRYSVGGLNFTVPEWAEYSGISKVTLSKRLARGIPPEIALVYKGTITKKVLGAITGVDNFCKV